MYPCLSIARHPTSWWNLIHGESSGWLNFHPGQDLYSHIISAMHFQGTPLAGGYATADDCVGGWGGCMAESPAGVGLVGMFDTQLDIAVGWGAIGIPKVCCLVSLLNRKPLS